MAATATTTEYSLGTIFAKLSLADSYIVLREENLESHEEIQHALNTTAEGMKQDWQERGVLLQAWVPDLDACLEIRARQDEDAAQYFNIDAQTTSTRSVYRSAQMKSEAYKNQGYDIKSAEWFRTSHDIRFLQIRYKRNVNGLITWGYAEKTVRNGWTVVLDYQVYGRGLKAKDLNSLRKATRTVEFTQTLDTPAKASGILNFSEIPPMETNTSSFTVEGTTNPGAHLIGVAMRWSASTPLKFTTDATKAGNFKLKITLPDEGVWLVTLNLEVNGAIVAEEVFDTTTFSRTVLPVVMAEDVPEKLTTNEFVVSGTTSKGVDIQCIVTNTAAPDHPFDSSARTNGTGKFKFKVPTAAEGTYEFTLVFTKKGYNTKRLTYTAVRTYTEQEKQAKSTTKAIHPGYAALNKKLESYIGQTMVYKAYIVDVQQNGGDWIITAALKKNKKGYSDFLVFDATRDPVLMPDSQVKIYGICIGSYPVQSEEGDTSYPRFEYLYAE